MGYGGLYSKGMHDYVMREVELGRRVAAFQDEEDIWGAWMMIEFARYRDDEEETDERS